MVVAVVAGSAWWFFHRSAWAATETVERELRALASDPQSNAFEKVREGWIANGCRSTRIIDANGYAIEAATFPFSPVARKTLNAAGDWVWVCHDSGRAPVDDSALFYQVRSLDSQFDPHIQTKDGLFLRALIDVDKKRVAYCNQGEWRDGEDGKPITATFSVSRGGLQRDGVLDIVNIASGKLLSRTQVRAGVSAEDAIQAVTHNREDRAGWQRMVLRGPMQGVALIEPRLIYSLDDGRLRVTVVGPEGYEVAVSAVLNR